MTDFAIKQFTESASNQYPKKYQIDMAKSVFRSVFSLILSVFVFK
jgi:hypothetical protein